MHRPLLTCAFLVLSTAAFAQQQQSSPSDPYEGQSHPPADDVIVATQPDQPAQAKPPAGKPMVAPQQAAQPVPPPANPVAPGSDTVAPASSGAAANSADPDVNGTDNGVVGVAKPESEVGNSPSLTARGAAADPDGDIVHPHPLQPGQLEDGTTIRVRLLTRLSTEDSHQGEIFRTRVASDVLQDGQVLIPAGAEIEGRVAQLASGTSRSHGTMLLRPDTVILPDGSRYHLDAQVTGTPGAKAHVSSEGFIDPGSRLKKDSMYYGGAVGAGAATGAMIGGPVGALAGGIIGASAVTLHIVTSHSEATLEPGTVLLFTLDNRLNLQAAASANPTAN